MIIKRNRSSRPEVFCKKGVLINFIKFTGKHLCQSLIFNKVAGLRFATLLKKILWHRCFPVNFVKFLATPFLLSTSGRLLLKKFWQAVKALFSDEINHKETVNLIDNGVTLFHEREIAEIFNFPINEPLVELFTNPVTDLSSLPDFAETPAF